MKIAFEMEDHEVRPTPIKIVDALIDHNLLCDYDDLEEIAELLMTYLKFARRNE